MRAGRKKENGVSPHFSGRKSGSAVIFTGLASLLLAVTLTGCDRDALPTPAPAAATRTLPVVTVAAAAPREYVAVGAVVSDHRVEVASRLSGYLRELRVREGDAVRRGELLARLDAPDVDGAIGQAKAALASADAAQRDAEADVSRVEQLFARGVVSDNELRKLRLQRDAARETRNQAQVALASATAQRDYAEIRSPVDGTVVAALRRGGDLVVPGAAVLAIESTGNRVFETTVTDAELAAVRPGVPVQVRIDGLLAPLAGRVARVVPSADPVTRSYPVKIALPATRGLLPGMFGRASFALGDSGNLLLPRAALIERGGLRGVFVLDDAGTVRFRWLRLGREWPDRLEVLAGLDAGERVVAHADAALREGDRVLPAVRAAGNGSTK